MAHSSSLSAGDALPLVSILVPVYNREQYLAEALESVLAQAYRPLELVVVDDGSTDGSAAIARRYAPMVRYELQPHGGIASARNGTLALAQGTYLGFLDSDDLWEEGQLAIQMEVLRNHPQVDCLFGHVAEFISPELDEETAGKLFCRPPMPSMGLGALIKAEAFRRVGPFRSHGQVGEFIDWHLRANELGLTSMTLPQVVVRRRLHASNETREHQSSRGDYLRVLKASLDRRRKER